MTQNSFWTNFLRPLKEKEKPEKYDAEFVIKRLQTEPELTLEKNENEDSRCLSRMILGQLQVQTQQNVKGKKIKVRVCDQQLSGLIPAGESDSPSRESSQSAHREVPPSTPVVRYGVSASANPDSDVSDVDSEDESSLGPSQKESVRKIAGIINAKDKIEKQKSHQQICVSSWTLKGLNSYITSNQLSLEKTLNASEVKVEQFDGGKFSDLQASLIHRSSQILASYQCFDDEDESGLKLWSLQFSDPMLKEMTVSLMVFEVLCAVCQLCDVRLKPEETLPKGEYPNARVDYALVYKDVVFGVVEIKTPPKMTAAAVAQLLLPLLKLQNESGQEEMQYVGILTDGFRYVFVRLQGDKFTFEDENYGTADHPKLHIRRAVKWNDLSALCGDIQSVFKSATDKLEEMAKK